MFKEVGLKTTLNSSNRYLAIYSVNDGSIKSAYQDFKSHFPPGKFLNQFALLRVKHDKLEDIILSALPLVHFRFPTAYMCYGVCNLRDENECYLSVFIESKKRSIPELLIQPASGVEAPPSKNIYRLPPSALPEGYYVYTDSNNNSYSTFAKVSSGVVMLRALPSMNKKKSILYNHAFPACNDLARVAVELSELREISEQVQNTFLEFLDEYLQRSRNHDASLFPGINGQKSLMEMYLKMFEEFVDLVKSLSSKPVATSTFAIVIKKIDPCVRSIKRQLTKSAGDVPEWLEFAGPLSEAESRRSRPSTKRSKQAFPTPEGVITMPLLEPYLDVSWPLKLESLPKSNDATISAYMQALRDRETSQLNEKRIGE